jgi:hypothetical protein
VNASEEGAMTRTFLRAALLALAMAVAGCSDDDDDGPPNCTADPAAVPDVAGNYAVSGPSLASSNCPSAIDQVIDDALERAEECVFAVGQDGVNVEAVDCEDDVYDGCVVESGETSFSTTRRESDLGCTVTVDAELSANLTASPTVGTLTLDIELSGTCLELDRDCTAVIDATVTRLPAEGAASGRTSPLGAAARAVAEAPH